MTVYTLMLIYITIALFLHTLTSSDIPYGVSSSFILLTNESTMSLLNR